MKITRISRMSGTSAVAVPALRLLDDYRPGRTYGWIWPAAA
jgi:hypothetical protein